MAPSRTSALLFTFLVAAAALWIPGAECAGPQLTLYVTDDALNPETAACDGSTFGGLCPYRSYVSDSTEKQVGYVSGFCTFVIPYQADSSFEQICYFTFFFGTNPDTVTDSISLQGHFTSADGNLLSIVGGTGKYAGAKGYNKKTFASSGGEGDRYSTYQHELYLM